MFNLIVKFMMDKNSMLLHALTSTERGVFSPRFVIVILVVRLYLFDTKIMVDKNSMVLSTLTRPERAFSYGFVVYSAPTT